MRHLDLFSGIGGFALSASRVWNDHEVVAFVEIDPFCRAVLKKHWPNTPIITDIREVTPETLTGPARIDLLTGGFPCQPFSQAGKRKGKEDDRYLWPEMLRVIAGVRPRWILVENVAGLVKMGLDQVLSDLEGHGYSCQTFIIPACAVNAPHRRDRVWIIAHTQSYGVHRGPKEVRGEERGQNNEVLSEPNDTNLSSSHSLSYAEGSSYGGGLGVSIKGREDEDSVQRDEVGSHFADGNSNATQPGFSRLQGGQRGEPHAKRAPSYGPITQRGNPWGVEWTEVALRTCVRGVDDGVPGRVDRLKSLGNAIVPQVAEEIFRSIELTDRLLG